MTVKELIKKLEQYPEDASVVIRSSNVAPYNDFNEITSDQLVKIKGTFLAMDPLTGKNTYNCSASVLNDRDCVELVSLEGGTAFQKGQ